MGPGIGLQGLVLFCLYIAGIMGALGAALVLRRTVTKGDEAGLPDGDCPNTRCQPRDLALGLWQRALIFLTRAGTIIVFTTIVLWVLLSFPSRLPGDHAAGRLFHRGARSRTVLEPVLRPIGFNRDIALALIPAMAARRWRCRRWLPSIRSTGADDEDGDGASPLSSGLRGRWSLPTALAFLAWFVFAPQCLSTLAVTQAGDELGGSGRCSWWPTSSCWPTLPPGRLRLGYLLFDSRRK